MNDYLAMLLGVALTLIVQSSSVTTSALTPLVGIGVLPVAKMLPMTHRQTLLIFFFVVCFFHVPFRPAKS